MGNRLRTSKSLRAEVERWVAEFAEALTAGDLTGVAALFHEDAWWRDMLTRTWDLRTVHGAGAIAAFVRETPDSAYRDLHVRADIPPAIVDSVRHPTALEGHITFETSVVKAVAIVKLTPTEDPAEPWKAWSLFTAADQILGHEEATGLRRPFGPVRGPRDSPAPTWAERRAAELAYEDRDPDVLIIGAGHSGLGLAARLGRLGVDALVVERNANVGDNWRKRYSSLVLHDAVWYDHLPYLDFPSSWPVYTPKDLFGEWIESYAKLLELNVWTGTEVGRCGYDDASGLWTIELRRADGTSRAVHPEHLVFATGTSGTEPRIPQLEGAAEFEGRILHSSQYVDAAGVRGTNAIVVGTGTSAHDIAQSLHEGGAAVTMLQRGPTFVIDTLNTHARVEDRPSRDIRNYSEGGPVDIADLVFMSTPYLAMRPGLQAIVRRINEDETGFLAGLHAAGFMTHDGPDGAGSLALYLEGGGGYYQNVGASELITQGRIAVRSGVTIDRLTRTGAVVSDGTELKAETIVLATGFELMGETVRRVLGEKEAARSGPIWGIDAEGELRSMWRPTGHPGLWYTGGNLQMSRFFSKILALQLKGRLEGLVTG